MSGAVGDTNAPVATSGLAEVRSQLRSEALRLDRAVKAGNHGEVAASALRVRDLAVAMTGKTGKLAAEKAREIETLLTNAVQITEEMRSHAAAGEASGLAAQNTQLQGVVQRVLALTAAV